MLVEGGGVCVKGSGRCLTHGVKLVREIKNLRMSDRHKDGFTMWRLRDSATLVCPASHPDKQRSSASMTSHNQNQSYKKMRMSDQSTPAGQDENG